MSLIEHKPVQLVDLAWQYAQIADEVEAEILEALRAGRYIGGKAVSDFERSFADYSEADHCIGLANGTDAVELALRAVGVGPGDKVAVPANTFIATAGAVARIGASSVLVDCGPDFLIDPTELERVIAKQPVKAVVPVHLYGQLANMSAIVEISAAVGATVIADGAQSQGARQAGKGMGAVAPVTSTSFYPGKNLGASGDAGAVITDDPEIARLVRLMANHGSEVRYQHEIIGMNSRLDHIHAIVLQAKLAKLEEWNERRREMANMYGEMLADVSGVKLPRVAVGNQHVWHLYVVRVDRRDEVVTFLNERGVGASIHYPVPVHLQPAFAHLGHGEGDFPEAEEGAQEILSLPMHPAMPDDQVERVVAVLAEAISAA